MSEVEKDIKVQLGLKIHYNNTKIELRKCAHRFNPQDVKFLDNILHIRHLS